MTLDSRLGRLYSHGLSSPPTYQCRRRQAHVSQVGSLVPLRVKAVHEQAAETLEVMAPESPVLVTGLLTTGGLASRQCRDCFSASTAPETPGIAAMRISLFCSIS